MRALHVTFRYGREVYGGAELYMRKLTENLHEKGVDIDVCTTRAHKLTPLIKSGVLWDNTLDSETLDNINILRFSTKNPNPYVSLIFEKLIQNQLDKEEEAAHHNLREIIDKSYSEKGAILLTGWNQLERHGKHQMIWTKKRAALLINDDDICEVSFSLLNRKGINVRANFKAQNFEKNICLAKNKDYENILVCVPNISGRLCITFELDRVWRPLKDFRGLGIAIAEITYRAGSTKKHLNLENTYDNFLIKNNLYINYLMFNTSKRKEIYGTFFDYLRGPSSHSMTRWLDRNIKNYDIILAQMFPFNTIKYSLISKKYNKPLVLLPLMHVDDEFYHWSHYYEFLHKADAVLAISNYSKKNFYDKIGVNSIYVGAGIDKSLFLEGDISGASFREKYKMKDKDIILTVSRKQQTKRYDLLIEAMDKVKQDFKEAHMVMIGPDDDKVPVGSERVSYLGKVGDDDLLNAYDACDVFAMMSESESFGLVFCEAWARKKPVIGNINCGPVAELIESGVDGFLCRDTEEIADRIKKLLEDRELAEKMGENGFKKVMGNYTWDKVADKVYAVYDNVMLR